MSHSTPPTREGQGKNSVLNCTACGVAVAHVAFPAPCPACGVPLQAAAAASGPVDGILPAAPAFEPLAPTSSAALEMIKIAGPVVATMSSYTAMQFVDGLMVSRIGPDPVYVAAQGNGGMAAWVPVSILMGLITVVNTYVSQNLGAGQPKRGSAYAWAGLWLCLLFWVVLVVPFALMVPWIFDRFMDHSPALTAMETSYARILLFGAIVTMATRCIAQYFYGMHRPAVVLIAALVGNAVNIVGNSLLIYGPVAPSPTGVMIFDQWFAFFASASRELGIPAYGVAGAAAATVIGTAVELALPLLIFIGPKFNRLYGTRASWRPSARYIMDILRLGWPGALMFGNEMICWAWLMTALIGRFGEEHNAAGWIALRYMHLAFMPAVGISIAVTAQVGKCMGMGRPDLAAKRAYLGLAMNMTYMGLCALGMVVFREETIALFLDPAMDGHTRARVIAIGATVMIAASVFQLFDALGITLIGALRGAGDTICPGIITVILAWSLLMGLGTYLAFQQPQLGSLGPWLGAAAYIIILGIALLARFLGGKWKTIKLVGQVVVAH